MRSVRTTDVGHTFRIVTSQLDMGSEKEKHIIVRWHQLFSSRMVISGVVVMHGLGIPSIEAFTLSNTTFLVSYNYVTAAWV